MAPIILSFTFFQVTDSRSSLNKACFKRQFEYHDVIAGAVGPSSLDPHHHYHHRHHHNDSTFPSSRFAAAVAASSPSGPVVAPTSSVVDFYNFHRSLPTMVPQGLAPGQTASVAGHFRFLANRT